MTPPLPSNQSFANVFAVFFALLAGFFAWKGGFYVPFLIASGLCFIAGLLVPQWLTPLNRAWMRFGGLLHRIVSPVVLGIMYFCLVTPIGVFMRRFAKYDPMKSKYDQSTDSYWVDRTPPGPSPQSFPEQF